MNIIKKLFCSNELEKIEELNKNSDKSLDRANSYLNEISEKDNQIKGFVEIAEKRLKEIEKLEAQINNKDLTPVDIWCQKNGYNPVKKVYKDKIVINSIKLPCDLREIFTPNSYLVRKVRDSIGMGENYTKENNRLLWYRRVMEKVNSIVKYRAEASDNYYFPAYTIKIKEGDCEEFAFLQMSIEGELGNAYGFFTNYEGKKIGHSFAVGVISGELWVFDAVGNIMLNYQIEDTPKYYIHYIITKNQVYELDGSVEFGDVLWD